jgi:hypothetical protein
MILDPSQLMDIELLLGMEKIKIMELFGTLEMLLEYALISKTNI